MRELGEMPMLIMVALRRPRQKDWYKFKVCLSYTMRPTSAWVTQQEPISKCKEEGL